MEQVAPKLGLVLHNLNNTQTGALRDCSGRRVERCRVRRALAQPRADAMRKSVKPCRGTRPCGITCSAASHEQSQIENAMRTEEQKAAGRDLLQCAILNEAGFRPRWPRANTR